MLLLKYLLELKNRLLLLILAWSTIFIICYTYKEILLYIIIKPSFNNIIFKLNKIYFITTNVTEIFNTYIELIYICSNKIIYVYFLIHFIMFLKNSLYKYEIKIVKNVILIYLTLLIFSTILLYFIILPISWNFFFNFQEINCNNQLNIYFESKLSEYLNFFTNLNKISNFTCQLFTFIFIYINNIKNYLNIIKQYKKLLFFFLFVITTLITPPDVINQLILGGLIITVYEMFIFLIIYINYINKVNH
jgi:sec-independent protein translocase protein TatC